MVLPSTLWLHYKKVKLLETSVYLLYLPLILPKKEVCN